MQRFWICRPVAWAIALGSVPGMHHVQGRLQAVRLDSLPALVTAYGRRDVRTVVASLRARPDATFRPAATGPPPH